MKIENLYEIIPYFVIIILLIIILIIFIKNKKLKKDNNFKNNDTEKGKNINEQISEKTIKESYPFKKVYLLTKNEWNFYKRLKLIIDKYNLSIIAKVRLADLIEVDSNKSINYQDDFDKIKSKHIDFAIVKSDNMEVKFLIELDDSKHNTSDRMIRDSFVENICKVTGYRLIRTLGDTTEIEKELLNNYFTFKKPEIKQSNNNDNYEKIIRLLYQKVNKIENILSEVESEPYIIENKEEDT